MTKYENKSLKKHTGNRCNIDLKKRAYNLKHNIPYKQLMGNYMTTVYDFIEAAKQYKKLKTRQLS